MEYKVTIEVNGKQTPVGIIEGNDANDSTFKYADSYLDEGLLPISISLPLQKEPFSPAQTRTFFEGLLPEGFTRKSVAQWLHYDEDDYLSILHGLGKECLGAIRITRPDEDDDESYEEIGWDTIKALASEGATKSTEIVTNTHLSLAGASGKVGLYYDDSNDRWYLPHGLAPSTHIVKQSHVRLKEIVTNEQLSMMTAAKSGIDTPKTFIINTGNGGDSDILFATRRYDRTIADDAELVTGLKRPHRLHQEDLSQAMGIKSAYKYEPAGSHYAKDMFDVIRKYSSDPLADQLKLWDRVVFNYIIGNNDGHIKNFSLLYDSDIKGVRLAPAYDIICTTIYESSTRDMSFSVGGELSIDDISREAFVTMASEVGLGANMAMKRYDAILDGFESALRESAKELSENGFVRANGLAEEILNSRKGGMK